MGANLPKICFGEKPSLCLPLQRIKTATNDSRDVMYEAEGMSGTRIITCDQGKKCSLFQAGIVDIQLNAVSWSSCNTNDRPDGLLDHFYNDEFPYDPWSSAYCGVRIFTGHSYDRAYMILPDHRSLEVYSKWLYFIGDEKEILVKRERAIHEIADVISSRVKSEKITEGIPPVKSATDLNYLDPYELWIREGLDLYTTPSQELLVRSDEELTVRFYNWALEHNWYPLNECIKKTGFAFSLQDSKQGRYTNFAYYSPLRDLIVFRPPCIRNMVNGNKHFDDDFFHECLHWEWRRYNVRDEVLSLLSEGMLLFFRKEHVSKKERRRLKKLLYSRFGESSGNEIRAYLLANPDISHRILNELMPFLSESAIIYSFDRLDEVLKGDQESIRMADVEASRDFLRNYKDAYLFYRRKLPAIFAKLSDLAASIATPRKTKRNSRFAP